VTSLNAFRRRSSHHVEMRSLACWCDVSQKLTATARDADWHRDGDREYCGISDSSWSWQKLWLSANRTVQNSRWIGESLAPAYHPSTKAAYSVRSRSWCSPATSVNATTGFPTAQRPFTESEWAACRRCERLLRHHHWQTGDGDLSGTPTRPGHSSIKRFTAQNGVSRRCVTA